MVNVLVTDQLIAGYLDEPSWEVLAGRPESEVVARLPEVDVLVGGRVTPAMAAAATRLRLLQVPGAGLDRVALDALPPHVTVCNTFHHGRSIAEHVVMVSLMLARRVLVADRMLRQGTWMSDERMGATLAGRTVGVVGLGEIGQSVVRALTALGMRAKAVRRDPVVPAGLPVAVAGMSGLDDLLSTSDIVVLTVPLTDETRGLIDASRLALMRRDAVLVNVARGPLVDEDALYDALSAGRIGGAALDVWWGHPRDGTKGYRRAFELLDNVVLTPHNSGHTHEVFVRRAAEIRANVARLTTGDPLTNVVRPARGTIG